MKLSLSKDGKWVKVTAQHAKDHSILEKFPGLLKSPNDNFSKYMPAVAPVVHNIVRRLKRHKANIIADDGSYELFKADWKLAPIPASFKYHTVPLDFQEIALRYMYTYRSGGILLSPGMGKTKVVLDGLYLLGVTGGIVICPKALQFVWRDEIETHRPELSYQVVESTDPKDLDWSKDLLIINYEKAVMMAKTLTSRSLGAVVFDEGLIKDPYSQRSALAHAISFKSDIRIVMSGTLVNNSPLDIFSVVKFLQPALVGSSFSKFKAEYTIQRKVTNANEGGANFQMVVGFKHRDELRSILDACSIVMLKEEWLKNLPEKVFEDISIPMTEEQLKLTDELTRNKRVETGSGSLEIELPLTLASKLYQISNGFLYLNSDDDESTFFDDLFGDGLKYKKTKKAKKPSSKNRPTYRLNEQPKAQALINWLQDNPNEKVIVWYNSNEEADIIESFLRQWMIPYISIKGGEKDVGGKVLQFNTDSTRVLLSQARVLNYGVTVMGSNKNKLSSDELEVAFPNLNPVVATEIFYSLSFSLEIYLQQQDRIHRIGQMRECRYVRLLAESPIEKRVVTALDSKMSIRSEMLVDVVYSLDGYTRTKTGSRPSKAKPVEEPEIKLEGLD